ncbi:MAG: caspase family protein [Sandaracinus sp.]|nr:caspase family protein [Sandaracinus sp.]
MARTRTAPRLDPRKTWSLLVGVLDYLELGKSFDKEQRQDQELDATLARWGIPERQRRTLLDQDATTDSVRASLREIVGKVRKGDTLLFYFAGHGSFGSEGPGLDTHDGSLRFAELATLLEECKGSVLLTADCCFSGLLSEVGESLHARGTPSAVLASIDGSGSTGQWTFTRTLVDAFAGRGFVDHDGDGKVSLADLAREQRLALHARDDQRSHASWHGIAPSLVLREVDDARTSDLAWCSVDGAPGRVIGNSGSSYRVRLCDVTTTTYRDVPKGCLRSIPPAPELEVGTKVWATPLGGVRSRGVVVAVEDGFHRVEYDRAEPLAHEWLPKMRLSSRDEKARPARASSDRVDPSRVETARLKRTAARRER